jgi:hypothetical protein
MRKTLVALAAAGTLAGATLYQPTPAHAVWWVAPAIIGGVVGGVALGAAAASANQRYMDPRLPAASYPRTGSVYVQPTAQCHISREVIDGRWRRVEICP